MRTSPMPFVLLLAACKGGDAPAPTVQGQAPSISKAGTVAVADACAVFTEKQLSDGLGATVTQLKGGAHLETMDGLPLAKCQWTVDGGSGGTVSLVVENFADERHAIDRFHAKFANHGYQKIDALGDEAIFARDTGNNAGQVRKATVQWRQGTAAYRFDLSRSDGLPRDATEAKLRDIATASF